MASNQKSFMIDDILRRDDSREEIDSPRSSLSFSSSSMIMAKRGMTSFGGDEVEMFSLYKQPFLQQEAEEEPSSHLKSQHQARLLSSLSHISLDANAQTSFWRQLLIRRKALLRLKPRKGGLVRFSRQQTIELEKTFVQKKYITSMERRHIADQIGLSDQQVKTWFQNRRSKWRKVHSVGEKAAIE